MSRRLLAALAGLALAAVFAVSFYRDRTQPQEYSTTWWDLFDTVTVVTGYAASEAEWQAQTDALYADLLRCHQLFDIYARYDGLVNLADVNAQAAAGPVAVSDDLMALLQFGKEAYDATGGACNIAAGTVLSLWHDAREAIQAAQAATGESAADDSALRALLPDGAALAQAAAHMDIDSLVLDEAAGTVFFCRPAAQAGRGGHRQRLGAGTRRAGRRGARAGKRAAQRRGQRAGHRHKAGRHALDGRGARAGRSLSPAGRSDAGTRAEFDRERRPGTVFHAGRRALPPPY